ncbi:MAG TPA: CHRD domain-containing protein [Balneolales bacterium]|nr:CHRD domain-containing protein [Balneolales bacterium]
MTRDRFQIFGLLCTLLIIGYSCENQALDSANSSQNQFVELKTGHGDLPGMASSIKRNFTAHLSGESGTPAAETKAQGEAILQISKDGSAISYKLILSNIENVLMAQIRIVPGEAGDNGDGNGGSEAGEDECGGHESGDEGCNGGEGEEGCGGNDGGHSGMGGNGQGCQVAVWLYPAGGPPTQLIEGRFDGVLVEGTITADDLWGPMRKKSLDALITIIRNGGAYVLVATSQYHGYQGGEIRGVIK